MISVRGVLLATSHRARLVGSSASATAQTRSLACSLRFACVLARARQVHRTRRVSLGGARWRGVAGRPIIWRRARDEPRSHGSEQQSPSSGGGNKLRAHAVRRCAEWKQTRCDKRQADNQTLHRPADCIAAKSVALALYCQIISSLAKQLCARDMALAAKRARSLSVAVAATVASARRVQLFRCARRMSPAAAAVSAKPHSSAR